MPTKNDGRKQAPAPAPCAGRDRRRRQRSRQQPAICVKSDVHEAVVNAFEEGVLEQFAETAEALPLDRRPREGAGAGDRGGGRCVNVGQSALIVTHAAVYRRNLSPCEGLAAHKYGHGK
jgi:hypothetical protein